MFSTCICTMPRIKRVRIILLFWVTVYGYKIPSTSYNPNTDTTRARLHLSLIMLGYHNSSSICKGSNSYLCCGIRARFKGLTRIALSTRPRLSNRAITIRLFYPESSGSLASGWSPCDHRLGTKLEKNLRKINLAPSKRATLGRSVEGSILTGLNKQ